MGDKEFLCYQHIINRIVQAELFITYLLLQRSVAVIQFSKVLLRIYAACLRSCTFLLPIILSVSAGPCGHTYRQLSNTSLEKQQSRHPESVFLLQGNRVPQPEPFRSSQCSLWSSVRPCLPASTYMMSFCHTALTMAFYLILKKSQSAQNKASSIVLILCFYSVSHFLCVCILLKLCQGRCWGIFTGIWGVFVIKNH